MLSGSARAKYRPKIQREPGIGASLYHSITALEEYENLSNEEIRIEDYKASGGLFGSAIAKIGATLCVEPKYKLKPYLLGKLYRTAMGVTANKPIAPETAPLNTAETENQSKKSTNLSVVIIGKKYFKVSVNGPGMSDINLLIKQEPTIENNKPECSRLHNPAKQPMHPKDYSHPYSTRRASSNLKTLKNFGIKGDERKFASRKNSLAGKENECEKKILKNSSQPKEGPVYMKQERVSRRHKK